MKPCILQAWDTSYSNLQLPKYMTGEYAGWSGDSTKLLPQASSEDFNISFVKFFMLRMYS